MDVRKLVRSRWLVPLGKLLVVALLAWGVRATILTALADLGKHSWMLHPWWLAAAGGLYLLSMAPAGLFWRHVLQAMGQDAGVWESLRAYIIGHLGKYVPGKALVVILRTGLIRGHRVDTALAAVSVFYETFSLMTSGSLLATVVLAIWYPQQTQLLLVSLGLLAAVGVPSLPPVFKRLVRFTSRVKAHPETMIQVNRIGFRQFWIGQLAMGLAWLLMGASLWAGLRGLESAPSVNDIAVATAESETPATVASAEPTLAELPLCLASIALAVVGGFLSMIPGGLGVRELILAQLMVPRFGEATAFGSSVLLRLTWLVAELGISTILYIVKPARLDRPDPAPPKPAT